MSLHCFARVLGISSSGQLPREGHWCKTLTCLSSRAGQHRSSRMQRRTFITVPSCLVLPLTCLHRIPRLSQADSLISPSMSKLSTSTLLSTSRWLGGAAMEAVMLRRPSARGCAASCVQKPAPTCVNEIRKITGGRLRQIYKRSLHARPVIQHQYLVGGKTMLKEMLRE